MATTINFFASNSGASGLAVGTLQCTRAEGFAKLRTEKNHMRAVHRKFCFTQMIIGNWADCNTPVCLDLSQSTKMAR